jgi:two-component system OmpR family sensor kinase
MTESAGAGSAVTKATATVEAAGLRARVRRLSLRTRLVAVLLGLLLLSCAALTVITSFALHDYLVGRLDQQLTAAGNRYAVSLEHPGDNAGFDSVVGQQVGTLGGRSVNGVVTAAGVVVCRRAGPVTSTYRVLVSTGSSSALVRTVICS